MPEQASLFGAGVQLDSPLEVHSLWVLALSTSGSARSNLSFLDLNLFYFILTDLAGSWRRWRRTQREYRKRRGIYHKAQPAIYNRSSEAGRRRRQAAPAIWKRVRNGLRQKIVYLWLLANLMSVTV